MNPTFSILHATYGRPEKAVAAMRMWWDRASKPWEVEYVFAVNQDDDSRKRLYPLANLAWDGVKIITDDFAGSAPAWDAAARISTGEILIQGQDDVEPPQDWDAHLVCKLRALPFEGGPDAWKDMPVVIAVADGYRSDSLLCTAICTRRRYKQQGCFLCPEFLSVYSDDDFTIRAHADTADGKCVFVNARDLVFLHQNPYHTGAPHDDTLRRENSPEAYALGSALFMQRNADLVARGFKTW
jgi:hypothetical protein